MERSADYSSDGNRATGPLTVLGIETSCDETAASVVRLSADGEAIVLSSVVHSQIDDHAAPAGVLASLPGPSRGIPEQSALGARGQHAGDQALAGLSAAGTGGEPGQEQSAELCRRRDPMPWIGGARPREHTVDGVARLNARAKLR